MNAEQKKIYNAIPNMSTEELVQTYDKIKENDSSEKELLKPTMKAITNGAFGERKKMSPETQNWILSKLGELSNKFYEVDKKHENI